MNKSIEISGESIHMHLGRVWVDLVSKVRIFHIKTGCGGGSTAQSVSYRSVMAQRLLANVQLTLTYLRTNVDRHPATFRWFPHILMLADGV